MAIVDKLSRRERQVMDVVYELEEASAKEIRQRLPDPPSYSAVRAVLTRLVDGGVLKFRESGLRYVYRAAEPKQQARKKALRKIIDTFFEGSAVHMMHALLGTAAHELSSEELDELERAIAAARKERT
jgi:predicted transcriptional regulator